MNKFTKHQPRDGDRILACDHLDEKRVFHFFKIQGPIICSTPDHRVIHPKWIILCDQCNTRNMGNPTAGVTADAVWNGDEPIIVGEKVN